MLKKYLAVALIGFASLNVSTSAFAGDDYMPSLITATPLEGRALAVTIVRKTIGTIQKDSEVKHKVRAIYADDPMMLMRAAELVSLEFNIIARANNYWR